MVKAPSPLLFDAPPAHPDFSLETRARRRGATCIAGVDEAGRGPLAGPVVVAAVVLDSQSCPPGLDDSKVMTAARREAAHEAIMASALAVSVAFAGPQSIDRLNIRAATLDAMRRAVGALALAPDLALIDGRDVPPDLACAGEAVVKGDARSLSIAAASIIAKVTRDRMMIALDASYPGYGFAAHMGYGTPAHLAALTRLGPCALHRLSFAPVRAARRS